jgi:uncharacterized protein (TIGR03437 family)
VVLGAPAWGQAPAYSAAGFVNASDYASGPFAPNSAISIFGSNLAWYARGITSDDIQAGRLPTSLNGVEVCVMNSPVPLFYVSPTQINFLMPIDRTENTVKVQVVRQGWTGPQVLLTLLEAAPALFASSADSGYALAQKWPAYSLIAPDSPASPGDLVILYATGLGNTLNDPSPPEEITQYPGKIIHFNTLQVYLDGRMVDPAKVLWAGLSPGNAGLYQVNLYLPEDTGPDPEIRLSLEGQASAAGLKLAVAQNGAPVP